MSATPLWLASASPRRRSILEWLGYTLDVRPADIDETRRPGEAPLVFAKRLALEKTEGIPSDRVGLAADTIVHFGDEVLGKPTDRGHAHRMLRQLSGRWHQVTTAVGFADRGERIVRAETTDVRFRALTDREIVAYLATGEADDKAGAYGIQGLAGMFVAEVRGCWTNVMGLPVEVVIDVLGAP